jgi:hypothetical protein
MTRASAPALLDPDTAEFIQRRVSITASGRDAANVPTSARVYGCRVSANRRTLTLFVARSQAMALLRNVAENHAIAVVFSRPTTHRTMQFKGSDARVEAFAPGDYNNVAEYVGSFVVEIGALGFPASFIHAAFAARPEDMAAIAFTPSDGFAQTPGPGAGDRLQRA